uniref:Guanine nucleotide-binding protein subunit gamma n=1 Tax=Acrobeloides nanus TaxID=290746 RepID=A0A914EJN4_9BILA
MSGRADAGTVQQARKTVEQIKRERNLGRTPISACANDLIRYTQEYQKDDYLLTGFPTDKLNPYRPKNTFQCLAL